MLEPLGVTLQYMYKPEYFPTKKMTRAYFQKVNPMSRSSSALGALFVLTLILLITTILVLNLFY